MTRRRKGSGGFNGAPTGSGSKAKGSKALGAASGYNPAGAKVKNPVGLAADPRQADMPKGLSKPEQALWIQSHTVDDNFSFYMPGAEDMPQNQSFEKLSQLQIALVNAGLLDPDQMALGVWDSASRSAFRELLGEANRGRTSWENALGQRLSLAEQGLISGKGSSGREKPPLTITLTNEKDIRAGLEQAAPDMLGRRLHDDELQPFVQQYHDLETQSQTQAYNQQYSDAGYGPGGTTVQAPSLQGFIDDQIRSKYKDEYQANQIGENGLYFLKMLGAGSGQVGLPGVQS